MLDYNVLFRSRSPLEEKGESRRGGGGEGEDGEYQDDGDTDREGGSTPEYGDHATSRKSSSSKGRSSKSRPSSSKKTSIAQQVCPPKHFFTLYFFTNNVFIITFSLKIFSKSTFFSNILSKFDTFKKKSKKMSILKIFLKIL